MNISTKTTLLLVILAVGVMAADSTASVSDSASYPPPNHNSFVPPTVGNSYVDPVFGETVTRFTDAMATGHEMLVAEYASTTVTNADESLVRLVNNSGGQLLYTLPGGAFVQYIAAGSSSPSDYWWDVNNPDILYHLDANKLSAYSVSAGATSPVHTFSQYGWLNGHGENNLSLDGNLIALQGDNEVFVYEFSSDSIIAKMNVSGSSVYGISVSPDGTRVVVNKDGRIECYGISNGSLVYERQLWHRLGHQDVGQDTDGTDYLIMIEDVDNKVQAIKLSDGSITTLIYIGWTMGAAIGAHISANSMHNDGWVYVSTQVDEDNDPNVLWPTYANEITRARIAGGVERLAHHRTQYNYGAGDRYYSVPRNTVSPSGRYVFWSSNMRQRIISNPNLPADYADTYMIDFGSTGPGSGTIAAPSNLQAGGFADPRIDLTWMDNSGNEDAVEVLRKGPNDAAFQLAAFLGANTTSFQDTAVLAGQEYCYQVVAHAGVTSSVPSNTACATPTAAPTAPAAPTALAAASNTETTVDLGWQDNASNEDMFDVRRRGPGESNFSSIATLNANATSYRDNAVIGGEQFCYEVMAKNGVGDSPPSNAACATPTLAPPPEPKPEPPPEPKPEPPPEPKPEPEPEPEVESAPVAPSSVRLELVGNTRVLVTWSDNSDDETRFEVRRRRGGRKYRRVGRVDPDTTAFTDNRVWRSDDYCYVVVARNDAGSTSSNEACVSVGADSAARTSKVGGGG